MYATFSLKNIKLINNSALLGGGIYGEYINIINDINNINIIGNSAPYYVAGFLGATFNSGEIDHLIRITNAVIANNVANTPSETCNLGNTCGGLYVIIGMSQNFETRLQIVNTTFAGNKTKSTQGGGLCLDSVKDKRRIDIVNSIFYNNTISHGAPGMTEKYQQIFIRNSDLSKINLAYNDIQGLSSGIALSDSSYLSTQAENSMFIVGNIDVDPMFVNTNNVYSIDNNSPVEGKGIDNLIIKGKKIFSPLTDILNKVRPFPFNKMPDMGAYEVGVK
jgi:predicted outer membrane repeat protein